MRPLIVALGLAAALSACAPVEGGGPTTNASSPRQCFNISTIDNFRQGDMGTIYLRARRGEVYQLSAAGGCPDVDFATRLAILPDPAGAVGTRLCTGDWARIGLAGDRLPSGCRVRIDRQLTAEEIAALRPGDRP
jgi:hypothetical protein